MKRLIQTVSVTAAAMLLLVLLVGVASAQDSPIKASLLAEKKSYLYNEPIKMQVRVLNQSGQEVITREGFQDQDFYLMITFIDPDGQPIRSRFRREGGAEPGPPFKCQSEDGAFIEIVGPAWDRTTVLNDARLWYDLTKYGRYTAQLFFAYETFSAYTTDPDTDVPCSFNSDRSSFFDPLASNQVSFEILPPEPITASSVEVTVKHLKIGGGSRPGAKKTPLEGVLVHLIPQEKVPDDLRPINHKTYSVIWDRVDPERAGVTGSDGVAKFEGVPRDNYLILAYYNASQDFKHMGSPVSADDPLWLTGQPIQKHLMVKEKPAKGKTKAKKRRARRKK